MDLCCTPAAHEHAKNHPDVAATEHGREVTTTGPRRTATEPQHRGIGEDEHADPHPRPHGAIVERFQAVATAAIGEC